MLDVNGGSAKENTKIIHYPKNSPMTNNQEWRFVYRGEGVYNIISKNMEDRRERSIYNNFEDNRYPIIQKQYPSNQLEQQWELKKIGEGYIIKSKKDGKIIEVSDGNNLKLVDKDDTKENKEQIWKMVKTSDYSP